jgi:hypothetical protein
MSDNNKKPEIFVRRRSIGRIPLIILHTFDGEGSAIFDKCSETDCGDFTLAAIGGIDWKRDLSPWETPSIGGNKYNFGGADGYIERLTGTILPEILAGLDEEPAFTAIAGYSLAGLFALYAAYKTDVFSRIASISGSLWFPGFTEFAESNRFVKKPEKIYLSLGDTEAKTRDKNLSTVRRNTEKLAGLWQNEGIAAKFELNPGNHFSDIPQRIAKGIKFIL